MICCLDRAYAGKNPTSELQTFRSVLTLSKSTVYHHYNIALRVPRTFNLLTNGIYTSIAIKLQFIAVDRFQTINLQMRNLDHIQIDTLQTL